ncbi:MAG: RluA family pseudouridine synthase, partial [Oscillospiraceae bacterium]|nr:RluA family pseudouridine synthase [Oscillospiraceae bacterium]
MILILYQDHDILICQKPPGLLSQSGPGPNMPDGLRKETGQTVYPVHRLDRGAGGIMVYARTQKAAAFLSDAIRRGELQKQYLCIVRGTPEQPSGIYQDLLLHDKTRNKSFVVQRLRGGVREASLSYQ